MALQKLLLLGLLAGCINAMPAIKDDAINADTSKTVVDDKEDLIGAPSTSYARRYSDYNGYNTGGYNSGGYNSGGYNSGGYNSGGYNNGVGVTGYGLLDDKYNSYYGQGGYDSSLGSGYNGYSGHGGYGGYSGYGGYKGYSGLGGYGGYGGYGGNGGLNSYYGYNNPYYQGANHLGFGYYKKPSVYGPITPSLVTGYRGYSR